MKYKLVTINDSKEEAIDVVEAGSNRQAKFYFMGRKSFNETQFDKIFKVCKYTDKDKRYNSE
tara:strand:+ start:315 stop:500 length:186 start_codon:yes stop_codon:yes gene_type:complete